jgi:hypothetical protein
MTTDEYRDLIAFLGTKFGEVDAQFRAVDARFQRVEVGLDDMRREMHEFRGEVDRRFSDVDQRMAAGFAEVKDLLRVSRRVKRLEEE